MADPKSILDDQERLGAALRAGTGVDRPAPPEPPNPPTPEMGAANRVVESQTAMKEQQKAARPVQVREPTTAPEESALPTPSLFGGITTGTSPLQAPQPGETLTQATIRELLQGAAEAKPGPWIPGLSSLKAEADQTLRDQRKQVALKRTLGGLSQETRMRAMEEAAGDQRELARRAFHEEAKQYGIENPTVALGVVTPLPQLQVKVSDARFTEWRRKHPSASPEEMWQARAEADQFAAETVGRWRLLDTGYTYYVKNPERMIDALMKKPLVVRLAAGSILSSQQGVHQGNISKWEASQHGPMAQFFRAMGPVANVAAGVIARTPREEMAYTLTGGLSAKPWFRLATSLPALGAEVMETAALAAVPAAEQESWAGLDKVFGSLWAPETPEGARTFVERAGDRRQVEAMLDGVDMLAVAGHLGEALAQDPYLQRLMFTPIGAPLMRKFSPSTQGLAAAIAVEMFQPDPVGLTMGVGGFAAKLGAKGMWMRKFAQHAATATDIERGATQFAKKPADLYAKLRESGEAFTTVFNARLAEKLSVMGKNTERFIVDAWERAEKYARLAPPGLAARVASLRGTTRHLEHTVAGLKDLIENTLGTTPARARQLATKASKAIAKIDAEMDPLNKKIDAAFRAWRAARLGTAPPTPTPQLPQDPAEVRKWVLRVMQLAQQRMVLMREYLKYAPGQTYYDRLKDLKVAKKMQRQAEQTYRAAGGTLSRDPLDPVIDLDPAVWERQVAEAIAETAEELKIAFSKAREVVEVYSPFAVPRIPRAKHGDLLGAAITSIDDEGEATIDLVKLKTGLESFYGKSVMDAYLASSDRYAKALKAMLDQGMTKLTPEMRAAIDTAIDQFEIFGRARDLRAKGLLSAEIYLNELRDPSVRTGVNLPGALHPLQNWVNQPLRWLRAIMRDLTPDLSRYGEWTEDVAAAMKGAYNWDSMAVHEQEEIGQIARGASFIPTVLRWVDDTTPIKLPRGFTTINTGSRTLWRQAQGYLLDWFDIADAEKAADPRGARKLTEHPAFEGLAHMWLPRGVEKLPPEESLKLLYVKARRAIKSSNSFAEFAEKMHAATASLGGVSGRISDLGEAADPRAYASGVRAIIAAVGQRKLIDLFGIAAGKSITPAEAEQINSVLSLAYGSLDDIDDAFELFARLGAPITRTDISQETRLSRKLFAWGKDSNGEKIFAPVQLVEQYNEVMTKKIKEYRAHAESPELLDLFGRAAYAVNHAWKTTMVGGLLVADISYQFASILWGDLGQLYGKRGAGMTARVGLDSIPGLIPGYGRFVQVHHQKLTAAVHSKFGNVPVLGSVSDALLNPQLNAILAGPEDQVHMIGGRAYTRKQMHDLAEQYGVLETQVSADILGAYEDAVKAWGFGGLLKWWQREISMHAHQLTLRMRFSHFVEEMKKGARPDVAGKLVNEALFDWKHGFAKWEINGLAMNGLMFYRYWKLAMRQVLQAQTEGFVRSNDPNFWAQAMIGQTELGRLRQLHLLGIQAPREKAWLDWQAEHKEELEALNAEEEAVFSMYAPQWYEGHGGTSNQTPMMEGLYWAKEGNRDRIRTFNSGPEIGSLGALAFLTSMQLYTASTAAAHLPGTGDYIDTNPYMIADIMKRAAEFLHPAMSEVLAPVIVDAEHPSARRRVLIDKPEADALKFTAWVPGINPEVRLNNDGQYTANESATVMIRLYPFFQQVPAWFRAFENQKFAEGTVKGMQQAMLQLTRVRTMTRAYSTEDLIRQRERIYREMRYAADEITEVEEGR